MLGTVVLGAIAALAAYLVYFLVIGPIFNPLQRLAGPVAKGWFKNHLQIVLE